MYSIIKRLILGMICLLVIVNCTKTNQSLDGLCSTPINASEFEINLTAGASSASFSTETSWWFESIILNDSVSVTQEELDLSHQDNFTVSYEEFTIEKTNGNQVKVSMSVNETGTERLLFIGLQSGNCYDSVKIIQSGE